MVSLAPNTKIRYNDKLLWLAGYPAAAFSFIFIANDNSFAKLVHLPTFFTDLIFAIAVTFASGIYLRWLVGRLDARLPWHGTMRRRLFWQGLLGILLPLALAMLLEVAYLYWADIPLAGSSILNLELPLALIFLLLANLFYVTVYLFRHKKTEIITVVKTVLPEPATSLTHITVQKGFTAIQIDMQDCAIIKSANKLLWLHTYNGEQFRLSGTLEEWETKLAAANFYRINRQYLAAPKAIQSVEQTDTRKLKVNFVVPIAEEVFVSKLNVASFRQWWNGPRPS